MPIFDRYLLRLFIRVLVVCFVSFFGLFFVADMFNHVDVFINASQEHGGGIVGLLTVLSDYYSPRVFMFFDRASAILALMACLFTLGWMQRTNELTAVSAAGISQARIVKPLLGAVVIVSLLGVANREFLIPKYRDELTRDVKDWNGEQHKAVHPRYDNETDIYLSGRATISRLKQLVEPNFRLPSGLSAFGRQLQAEVAVHQPATADHPEGYLLKNVHQPKDIDAIPSGTLNGRTVIYTAADTEWLKPQECFVASRVAFDQLAAGNAWYAYSSSLELIHALRNPSLDHGADVRRAVHARLVQPVLDFLLLMMGLPLVFTQRGRNVFVAAGLCAGVIVVFMLVTLACQAAGNNYLLSPAFSAWCPIVIFAPIAHFMASSIWD